MKREFKAEGSNFEATPCPVQIETELLLNLPILNLGL